MEEWKLGKVAGKTVTQGVAIGLGYKWFSTILRNFEKTLCELGGKTATSATIYDRIINLIFT